MRKISASYIFPVASSPVKNGVISIDDDGTIVSIAAPTNEKDAAVEFYEGIICPGFINTHCHLELSHFRGQMTEKAGMTQFIKEILSKRPHFTPEEIQKGIAAGEAEMISNGIMAVGDISNDSSTFAQKAKGNLLYHTFIEAFDLNPDRANEVFKTALDLKTQLSQTAHLKSHISIVPHAPYTVSDQLFALIAEEAVKDNSIISIHNQESLTESELFISKSGLMYDAFTKVGINMDFITTTGKNSLHSIFHKLPLTKKILLVHNTFTSSEDIQWANEQVKTLNPKSQILNPYWCTCPNANLYIENALPNYDYFISANVPVTIGTDSLASNWSLSVLDELKTIVKHNPHISSETLLTWATKNGADFLGLDHLGTIEKGKKPGLNLLKNMDGLKITGETTVTKLV
ncbi:MAG: hypothetical protein JWP12_2664 [Bacteroidetes bacterium]|nr:hypothetical protein [Bacteroidota bacterium]